MKVAASLPILTLLAPVKLTPVRVTWVPTGPLAGLKLVMTGGIVNALLLTPEPKGLMTVILADTGPEAGTVNAREVSELTVKPTDVLPNLTVVARVKLTPVRVT